MRGGDHAVISERSQSVSREMRCNDFEPPLPKTVRPNALCAVTPRLPCALGTLRPRERSRRRFVQGVTGGALAVVGGRHLRWATAANPKAVLSGTEFNLEI